MRYIIERASGKGKKEGPCEGAFLLRTDPRVYHNAYVPEGINHTVNIWAIEIDDLHEFIKTASGGSALLTWSQKENLMELKIYDDFLE